MLSKSIKLINGDIIEIEVPENATDEQLKDFAERLARNYVNYDVVRTVEANIKLPNGRTVEIEIPEDLSSDQIKNFSDSVAQYFNREQRLLEDIVNTPEFKALKPKDGNDGEDGSDGEDGNDGEDGVGVNKIYLEDNTIFTSYTNGEVYSLGEMPLPKDGENGIGVERLYKENKKIYVEYTNGEKKYLLDLPQDGKPGKDAPRIKNFIKNPLDELIVFLEDGTTYNVGELPKANDGEDGEDGEPGKNADIIKSIDVNKKHELVVTMDSGRVLKTKIPFIDTGGDVFVSNQLKGDQSNLGNAKGDLLVFNGNVWLQVPIGSDGEFLAVDSTQDSNVSWSTVSHNALAGLQGGTTDEYYHLSNADYGLFSRDLPSSLSSGVHEGCEVSINSDPTKIDISAGTYTIVDNWTDPQNPVVYDVDFAAQTGVTVTNLATSTVTFVLLDKDGNVIQQTTDPDSSDYRDYVVLAQLGHTSGTAVANAIRRPSVYASPVSQFRDLLGFLGVLNQGNIISANGANLNLNKTAGKLFSEGNNFYVDDKEPNVANLDAETAFDFRYRSQTGEGFNSITSVDPNSYDNNGTITAIGGNRYTNQRVFILPNGNIVIQYGQELYNTQSAALEAIPTEDFTIFRNLNGTSALLCIITLKKGSTDLSDDTDAVFTEINAFTGTGSGSGGTTTLQQVYDNSTSPEITTDSTRGALTIKRGSAADTDSVLEIENNAGTVTFDVTGEGVVNALSTTASTSSTTGALVVSGGMGLAGDLYSDGRIFAENTGGGNPATPSFSSNTDSDTGFDIPGVGAARIVVSGSSVIDIASTGVDINATTASTSSTTGALVVDGGMGLAGDLYSDGRVFAENTGGGNPATPSFSSNTDSDTGFDIPGVGAARIVVSGSSVIDIASTGVDINATTASTSSTTGALVVDGGMGLAGDLYSDGRVFAENTGGGNPATPSFSSNTDPDTGFDIPGVGAARIVLGGSSKMDFSGSQLNINYTDDATSSTTGGVVIDSGMGVAKKLYVGTQINIGGSTNNTLLNVGSGSASNEMGKARIYNGDGLGSTLNNATAIMQYGGAASNTFVNTKWLLRDAAGSDWTTARLHDAISIDTSFTTPRTNTKCWIERDPQSGIFEFGNDATSYFTINAGKVGVGIAAPISTLHAYENTTSNGTTAGLTVEQNGTGDAVTQHYLTGSTRHQQGIDRSNSNSWVESFSSTLGASPHRIVTTSGQQTMPLQCRFEAYNSVSDTNVTGDGTIYSPIFDDVSFNYGSHYNNTTGIFTTPIAGTYEFEVGILLQNVTNAHQRFDVNLNAGGTDYPLSLVNAGSTHAGGFLKTASNSKKLDLDGSVQVKVTIVVYSSTKTIILFGSNNWTCFSGMLVC